ncbi:MAG: hypothetical protein V4858_12500 [Pseudomonadota bacterium]
MKFSSTVNILKVNELETGVSGKTGKPWDRMTAECALLDDDGVLECVGRLVIPQAMREGIKTGVYRAGFALVVPTFGDQKGDITARLTALTPVPVKGVPTPPRAPVAA